MTPMLPARYLPLAFGGTVATALTITLLRLAGVDLRAAAALFGLKDPALFRVWVYGLWAALTALVLVRVLKGRGFGADALGWRRGLNPGAAGMAFLAALGAIFIWFPVDAVRQALGIPLYWDPNQQGFIRPTTGWEFVVAGLTGLVLVPLSEETIFRGYVLQALVSGFGVWAGLLGHNLLFALYHLGIGPGLPLYIFFWSFFPAILFLKYKGIYPAVLMHALNNVWVDLLMPLFFD